MDLAGNDTARQNVEGREESAAIELSHSGGFLGPTSVVRRPAAGGYATISVSRYRAPFAVDRNIIEVEEVSVTRATKDAGKTDGSLLHRIAGRCIDGYPVSAAVISCRHVKVPYSLEGGQVLEVSPCGAAEEPKGGAIAVTGYDHWKDGTLDPARSVLISGSAAERGSDFPVVRPIHAVVSGDRDMGTVVAIDVTKVNGVVATDSDRGITAADTVRHRVVARFVFI